MVVNIHFILFWNIYLSSMTLEVQLYILLVPGFILWRKLFIKIMVLYYSAMFDLLQGELKPQ